MQVLSTAPGVGNHGAETEVLRHLPDIDVPVAVAVRIVRNPGKILFADPAARLMTIKILVPVVDVTM